MVGKHRRVGVVLADSGSGHRPLNAHAAFWACLDSTHAHETPSQSLRRDDGGQAWVVIDKVATRELSVDNGVASPLVFNALPFSEILNAIQVERLSELAALGEQLFEE